MVSVFNTVESQTGKTARIVNFLQTIESFYIAIGKPTPWDSSWGLNISDINPPTPLASTSFIPEPIIFKRVDVGSGSSLNVGAGFRVSKCNQATQNEEALSSVVLLQETPTQQNYTILPVEDIVNNDGSFRSNPEFVYVSGEILGEDYDTDEWRASALFTRLFLEPGVSQNQLIYTPNEVRGGLLQHLTYNTPVERDDGKIHKFEYLINI